MVEIVLGIGSNIGDRKSSIDQAVNLLLDRCVIKNTVISGFYASKALLPDNAPHVWDIDFLNIAIKADTELLPNNLLKEIKKIEQNMGRINLGKWSPRIIDIDILAYGFKQISSTKLTIPHPGLFVRDFALIPFAEVWPDWQYQQLTIQEWVKKLPISKEFKLVKF